jgi:sugar lactone lactonase YvrE
VYKYLSIRFNPKNKINRIMKSKIPPHCQLFSAVLYTGAIVLITTVARSQNLYVTANGSGNIYNYTPGGVQSTFASGLSLPYGLAFDSTGDLFEADQSSGNVYEFAPGGARSTFASGLAQPCGLAFDSTGNLFVSQLGTGPTNTGLITKITPGGAQSTFASGLNPNQSGLTFNSAGDLFMPDGEAGAIDEFTPGGSKSTFASGLFLPRGLAFSSTGNLFVSAANNTTSLGIIYEFTPGGMRTTFASSGLSVAVSLAFNSAGNLFVADYSSGHIFEYTPDGTQSTFASGLNEPAGLAFQPVPEPSGLSVLVVGILTLLIRHRRK